MTAHRYRAVELIQPTTVPKHLSWDVVGPDSCYISSHNTKQEAEAQAERLNEAAARAWDEGAEAAWTDEQNRLIYEAGGQYEPAHENPYEKELNIR